MRRFRRWDVRVVEAVVHRRQGPSNENRVDGFTRDD